MRNVLNAAGWIEVGVLIISLTVTVLGGSARNPFLALILTIVSICLLLKHVFPSVLNFILITMLFVNAAGWTLNLYDLFAPFDKGVHFFTIFALTLLAGYVAQEQLHEIKQARIAFIILVACVGISIGAFWEMVEYTAGKYFFSNPVKGVEDTITDLMADSIGAVLGGITHYFLPKRKE